MTTRSFYLWCAPRGVVQSWRFVTTYAAWWIRGTCSLLDAWTFAAPGPRRSYGYGLNTSPLYFLLGKLGAEARRDLSRPVADAGRERSR